MRPSRLEHLASRAASPDIRLQGEQTNRSEKVFVPVKVLPSCQVDVRVEDLKAFPQITSRCFISIFLSLFFLQLSKVTTQAAKLTESS